jgi:hypothetical protein
MKKLLLFALPLFAFASSVRADDWTKRMGAGGYVGFAHYAVADQDLNLTTQGLSFVYGAKGRIRVGANAGLFVSNRGGDTGGTVTGLSLAPTLSYDVVQKPGGVFYVVTHALSYDLVKNSGNVPDAWNLDIFNAGVGIEGLISHDVGLALEGDAVRFGVTRALRHTETHIGVFAFPSVRFIARMYF